MSEKNEAQISENLERLREINEAGDSVYCKTVTKEESREGDYLVADDGNPLYLRRVDYEEARDILSAGDNVSIIFKRSKLGKIMLEG